MVVLRKSKKKTIAVALAYYYYCEVNSIKQPRKKWEKNWLKQRQRYSHMNLLRNLRINDPDDFKNYLRMDCKVFDELLFILKPYLIRQDTRMRRSIPAEERLAATLRFLATGRSYEDLKFSVAISAQALGYIIPETCRVIYEVLKGEYMKFPSSKNEWKTIFGDFKNIWQIPNCAGAIDGKHIRIVPPGGTGAMYYNYKGFYSIVLMAIVNAKYEFTYVDVGKNGRLSDGGVIEYTSFNTRLQNDKLNLPENYENEANLNSIFLADDAFALHQNIVKPFPQRNLTYEKQIFNYRLSRGRNVVENSFGIIASRFRILHTAINLQPERLNYVILAICVLHNYLCRNGGKYSTATTFDRENREHELIPGDWREDEVVQLAGLNIQGQNRNVSLDAKKNRDQYMAYFNGDGKVDWQDSMIRKGKA